MFGWLRTSSSDNWNNSGLKTAEELLVLAASNQIVASEVAEFRARVADVSQEERIAAARQACRALSGYGIAVAESAFLDVVN